MNATRLSDRGQAGQLDRAGLEQPTPHRTVGRVAAIRAPQNDRVDPGLYTPPAGTWLLWK
jgi:hypothetical protein